MSRWRARLRLAGVEALGCEELVEAGVDAVGDLPSKSVRSVTDILPHGPESAALAARARRVDLGRATLGNEADDAVVEGRRFSQNLPVEPSVNAPSMKWAASRARAVGSRTSSGRTSNRHCCTSFGPRSASKVPGPISLLFHIVDIFLNMTIVVAATTKRQGGVERRSRAGCSRRPIVVLRAARDADRADDRAILHDRQAAAEQDHPRTEGMP